MIRGITTIADYRAREAFEGSRWVGGSLRKDSFGEGSLAAMFGRAVALWCGCAWLVDFSARGARATLVGEELRQSRRRRTGSENPLSQKALENRR